MLRNDFEKKILGIVTTGRAGLGVSPSIRVDKAAGKEKHQLLQGEIRKGEEKNRMGKMVGVETTRSLDTMGVYGPSENQMVRLMAKRCSHKISNTVRIRYPS